MSISPRTLGLTVEGEGDRDIYKETQVPGSSAWCPVPLLAEMGDVAGGRGVAGAGGDHCHVCDAGGTASRGCLHHGQGGRNPRREGCAVRGQHVSQGFFTWDPLKLQGAPKPFGIAKNYGTHSSRVRVHSYLLIFEGAFVPKMLRNF